MKFTIENILGDKICSRSSSERRQPVVEDDAVGRRLRDGEPSSRPTSTAHASATELLLARAPQPIAGDNRPPQDCRKRKSLSDGEDDDNDMSGANMVAWIM